MINGEEQGEKHYKFALSSENITLPSEKLLYQEEKDMERERRDRNRIKLEMRKRKITKAGERKKTEKNCKKND